MRMKTAGAALIMCLSAVAAYPQIAQKKVPARFALPEGVRVIKDIQYSSPDGNPLMLDIYLPKEDNKPLPLIVWIHGGGWQAGSRANCLPAQRLLSYGYAVASISYRLTGISSFPAQIEDCKSAVRFLRANAEKYNINPEKIGAWGSSAGGHLAALLGTAGGVKEFDKGESLNFSGRVSAVCDYYGPSYLPDMVSGGRSVSPVENLIGEAAEGRLERAVKASPVTYVSKDSAPFLIVQGDKDNTVNVEQSRLLHRKLTEAGVHSDLRIINNAGHGGPEFTSPEIIEAVAAFFDRYLK